MGRQRKRPRAGSHEVSGQTSRLVTHLTVDPSTVGQGHSDWNAKNNAAAARLYPFMLKKDYRGAVRLLKRLGADEAEPYWIAYHLGKVYGYRGDWEKALHHLEEAARLAPRSPVVFHGLGIALNELRRFEEAAAAHGEAVRLQRDYVEGWQSLGLALLHAGDSDGAAQAFRAALIHLTRQAFRAEGLPVHPPADTASGIAEDDPLNHELSLPESVAVALVEDGRFADITYHLGMAHVAADRHARAKEAFENAAAMGLREPALGLAQGWLAKLAAGKVGLKLN